MSARIFCGPFANDIGRQQTVFSCHGLNFTDYGSNQANFWPLKKIRFNEFGRQGNKVPSPKPRAHSLPSPHSHPFSIEVPFIGAKNCRCLSFAGWQSKCSQGLPNWTSDACADICK